MVRYVKHNWLFVNWDMYWITGIGPFLWRDSKAKDANYGHMIIPKASSDQLYAASYDPCKIAAIQLSYLHAILIRAADQNRIMKDAKKNIDLMPFVNQREEVRSTTVSC